MLASLSVLSFVLMSRLCLVAFVVAPVVVLVGGGVGCGCRVPCLLLRSK